MGKRDPWNQKKVDTENTAQQGSRGKVTSGRGKITV
jgi:hypothetical protein